MPKYFQNYGDPESEKLIQPQLDLPPNFDSLPQSEQASIQEIYRKRLVHFLYAVLAKRLNEEHYDAIFDNSVILHQLLFKSAGTPWECDSITLQADIIRSIQDWPILTSPESLAHDNEKCSVPPIKYSETVVQKVLDLDAQQKEADEALDQMRSLVSVNVLGWLPNDEYEAVKEVAHQIKVHMLEAAENEDYITAVQDHFPFDDFDERA